MQSPPDTAGQRGEHGRKAGRTAWIIGGIALAFYAIALVLGHFGHLNTSWNPQAAANQAVTAAASPAANHQPSSSQP